MKDEKKTAIVESEENKALTTPAKLLEIAVSNGADVANLEKLMGLQERWEANEARKAYVKAMTEFKADPPLINKDKTVSYKDVKYNHASLANVTETINKALSGHGLSAAWNTKQNNGDITVSCVITHIAGHSESTSLTAKSDTSGSKNAIQAIGSTVSYLERYTILALTGLSTHEMDDDARSASDRIGFEEIEELIALLAETESDENKFLEYLKVDAFSDITQEQFKKAKISIEAKKSTMEKFQ